MKRRSFTLIEILIVLAVFGIMIGLTFEILSSGSSSRDVGSAQQDAQEQANQGLESMVNELYQTNAAKILEPVTHPFSNAKAITFKIPSGYDANGAIIWGAGETDTTNYNKINYSIANNQLIRQVLNSSGVVQSDKTKILANFIESLSFSLANNELLTVTLKAQKAITGIELSDRAAGQVFTATVSFRN